MDILDKIRLSFKRIKIDILSLNSQIQALEGQMNEINSKLDQLLLINTAPDYPKKPKMAEFEGLGAQNTKIHKSSTGNEGVLRRQRDDKETTKSRQRADNPTLNLRQSDTKSIEKLDNFYDIKTYKKELESRFLSLTDAQFNVFMAIYRIEEQTKTAVTYAEIASELTLSQSSIRDYVSDLILRKVPLTKHSSPNRKVYLSITNEFKNLNMLENLYNLREKDHSQTKLSGQLRNFF